MFLVTVCLETRNLVSHYSAVGDTSSRDAPYSAIGFRGKLLLRYSPSKACLWIAIDHLYRKKWGCSSDSLRYHRKHSATGVMLHLSPDRGGYLGRVTGTRKHTRYKCWLYIGDRGSGAGETCICCQPSLRLLIFNLCNQPSAIQEVNLLQCSLQPGD